MKDIKEKRKYLMLNSIGLLIALSLIFAITYLVKSNSEQIKNIVSRINVKVITVTPKHPLNPSPLQVYVSIFVSTITPIPYSNTIHTNFQNMYYSYFPQITDNGKLEMLTTTIQGSTNTELEIYEITQPTKNDTVELFTSTYRENLVNTIKNHFSQKYDMNTNCIVTSETEEKGISYPIGKELASIHYNQNNIDKGKPIDPTKCPTDYMNINGDKFFLMDNGNQQTFAFINDSIKISGGMDINGKLIDWTSTILFQ